MFHYMFFLDWWWNFTTIACDSQVSVEVLAIFCFAKAQEQPLVAVALRVPPLQPLQPEERYIATRPSLLEEGRGEGNGDAVTGGAVCWATSEWLIKQ